MARVTNTDKWVIGGEGQWRDLIPLPPPLKLTLDLIVKHPLVVFMTLWTTIIFIYTQSWEITLVVCLLSMAARKTVKVAAHYLLIVWRKQMFENRNRLSDSLVVPLDKDYHPRSALTLDRHILIGGDSGTGKSNQVWSILKHLRNQNLPHRLYVIDPAGGVELADLEHGEFTSLYTDNPHLANSVIESFRDKMNERLAKMKQASIRKHIPTHQEPNYYLIIDELLLCKKQIKDGVGGALGEVLAVGRKGGFIVIGCTQLGQKTTLGDLRDMFPQRIAFGTRSQEMTDAILGTGASRSGAPAYELTEPGTAYFFTTEHRKYFKFQGEYITDTHSIANPDITNITTPPTSILNSQPTNEKPSTSKINNGTQKTCLYRLYGDNGILVYVGVTKDPQRRLREHREKEWWPSVSERRTKLEWYPDREAALSAERQAIEDEMPIYNVIGQ